MKHLTFPSILFLFLFIFHFSCKKEKLNSKVETPISVQDSTDMVLNYTIAEKLNQSAEKLVSDWTEYKDVDRFLENNGSNTNEQALFNAKEFATLTEKLKDTIVVEEINIPSLKIRLNVLYNEALRLQDMSTISVITGKEVHQERQKIYDAFSAINFKLNNLTDQAKINEQLKQFADEMVLDTTVRTNLSEPALDSLDSQ
ncbi:hypothetical protein [Namhaeicola litoreus]|uniref:Uncharacterized protein n=1 Tax=Namhaeicola litoreus TaxID=1052145 RepID=A0ABW3Y118_9FLAO